MIEFNNQGLTIHDKLNKEESILFCKFLIAEQKRHQDDIKMILHTVDYLGNKFEFDAEILKSIYEQ
jgi:hypothetical protein